MKSTKIECRGGFTLIEMMVVVGLLAILMATLTTSLSGAQKRAKIAKAESEVKIITQAILGYENWSQGHELPTMKDRDADQGSVGFLIGKGGAADSGGKIPALLMGQLTSGGKMMDPWNTPYRISITQGSINFRMETATGNLMTGYHYPNYHRLTAEERQ